MEDNEKTPQQETERDPWGYYNQINSTTPTPPRPRTGNPRFTPKKHKRPKGIKHGHRKNTAKK